MIDALNNPWIMAFVAPLIAAALSVFVRWSSRNDRHATFTKEDCAVGQELCVAAIIYLVGSFPTLHAAEAARSGAGTTSGSEATIGTALLIAGFLVGLWIISTVVRKIGWRTPKTLRWLPGLITPLIFGIATLLTAVLWVSQNAK